MVFSDTFYTDIEQGIITLMDADAYLRAGGTYKIKRRAQGFKPVEDEFPSIHVDVVGDERDSGMDSNFEFGGAAGNIYHNVAHLTTFVYQAWTGGSEEEALNGTTVNNVSGTETKYGIKQIACYLRAFYTQNYTIDGIVFHFRWTGTVFIPANDDEDRGWLAHAQVSADALYKLQL